MGKLADLVAGEFGGPVVARVNRELSSVGKTAARFLRLDADRVGATIVNLSAAKMYVGPFQNPSATMGELVGPNGGQRVIRWYEDFLTVGDEWFVVASAANSALYVMELIAQGIPGPTTPEEAGALRFSGPAVTNVEIRNPPRGGRPRR